MGARKECACLGPVGERRSQRTLEDPKVLLDLHLRQGQAKATKLSLLRAVVFLEPQRPVCDLVLPTPSTAASAQCLPLQHHFYLVMLEVL